MKNDAETPWLAIHDLLREVGQERSADDLLDAAASLLRGLVPYDFAQVVFPGPLDRVSRMRCIDLPDSFAASYPTHFESLHGRFSRTRLSDNPKLFYTTSKPFLRTAFGADWVRPLGVAYSTGIAVDAPDGRTLALIILYRSRCSMGFSERDRRTLGLIEPHLANLFACLSQADPLGPPATGVEERVESFGQLSPREKEIVIALCRGESTHQVSSRLGIRPSTLYRHANNVYDKLGISSRQALIAKVLRTG